MQAIRYKYKREDRLNCKLSEEQIEKIRVLYKLGCTQSWLAKKFKVSDGTIYYWIDEERRKKLIRESSLRAAEKQKDKKYNHEITKKYRERKKKLLDEGKYQNNNTKTARIIILLNDIKSGKYDGKKNKELLIEELRKLF